MVGRAFRWGFWVRISRFGPGVALHNHNQHPPLFSERYRAGGSRYFHLGPWCFRKLPRLRAFEAAVSRSPVADLSPSGQTPEEGKS